MKIYKNGCPVFTRDSTILKIVIPSHYRMIESPTQDKMLEEKEEGVNNTRDRRITRL